MGTYQGRHIAKSEEAENITISSPPVTEDPSAPIFGSPIDSKYKKQKYTIILLMLQYNS